MFQEWHDHLITNGGKIFDPDFGKTRTRVRKVHRMSSLSKALLTFSLLANFAVLIFFGRVAVVPLMRPLILDLGVGGDQSISRVSPSDVALVERNQAGPGKRIFVTEEEASGPSKDRLVPTLPPPDPTWSTCWPSPVSSQAKTPFACSRSRTGERDCFHGSKLQGKHAVYLLDVGTQCSG